ncbi:MAG: RidA family protein [Dehalococcoidia bacterium]
MKRQAFHSDKAAPPKGPYSQAIIYDELLYVSGQGPVEPATGSIVRGTIEEEARVTLNNLKTIIEEAGYALEGVLKVTCYLSNMDDFVEFNKVYSEYFPDAPPARTTLQAGRLPMDIKVEIDAIVGHTEGA